MTPLSIAEQIDLRTREPGRCKACSCHSAEARHRADALGARITRNAQKREFAHQATFIKN
jgi:hypothetical protein